MMLIGLGLILIGAGMLYVVEPDQIVWDWRDAVVLAPVIVGLVLACCTPLAQTYGVLP
jgi:hypothetical protein